MAHGNLAQKRAKTLGWSVEKLDEYPASSLNAI
jgi:hypothetical protein